MTMALRALTAIKDLEEGGRGGVGGGDQGGHHAHRPGDLVQPAGGVLADHTDRFQVADAFPDRARAELILEFLVRGHAVAGLFLGQAPQALGGLVAGFGHGRADAVHLLLGGPAPALPGLMRCSHQVARFLNGGEILIHRFILGISCQKNFRLNPFGRSSSNLRTIDYS